MTGLTLSFSARVSITIMNLSHLKSTRRYAPSRRSGGLIASWRLSFRTWINLRWISNLNSAAHDLFNSIFLLALYLNHQCRPRHSNCSVLPKNTKLCMFTQSRLGIVAHTIVQCMPKGVKV